MELERTNQNQMTAIGRAAALHIAFWQYDPLYRRAWFVWPQATSGTVLSARSLEIFDLTDALTARNALAALAQVARLMAQGSHPLALLGPIASAVRRLLIARQFIDQETRRVKRRMSPDELVRNMPEETTRMLSNPKAAYHAVMKAQSFTTKKLARDLELVYETDFRLKSSNHSRRITMERLILGLCEK